MIRDQSPMASIQVVKKLLYGLDNGKYFFVDLRIFLLCRSHRTISIRYWTFLIHCLDNVKVQHLDLFY